MYYINGFQLRLTP